MSDLLTRVEQLVKNGNTVCPLNADVYFEILKQQDPLTLRASVKLLDELSGGACLIPVTARLPLEVAHFCEMAFSGPARVYELHELVWTRPAYIIGFVTPDMHQLTRAQNVELQKRFVDHLWEMTLFGLLDVMDFSKAAARTYPFNDISGPLNQGKLDHADVHKSFKSVFLSEVAGAVDVYKSEFADYFQYRFERDSGSTLSDKVKAEDESGVGIANLICEAFRLDRAGKAFSTIRIGAGLHAALRWDRKRKYKANDLFDFRHAEAALPYCDYFFTERSLRNLLSDRNLHFEEYFPCKVYSDPVEALVAIASI